MPALMVSRSEALKTEVMAALATLPERRVEGETWSEIKEGLGLDPAVVSNNVLTSALWKLVNEGKLCRKVERDPDPESRGFYPVVKRIYWIP